uniref:Uncharacterized protein n=1 Tax=Kalanchoe fedtschenkoi TaxID=63787 RepID=A0A7N1A412_KALFE
MTLNWKRGPAQPNETRKPDPMRAAAPSPPPTATAGSAPAALDECLVSVVCPDEAEAVRTLCSRSGTDLKRSRESGTSAVAGGLPFGHQIDG